MELRRWIRIRPRRRLLRSLQQQLLSNHVHVIPAPLPFASASGRGGGHDPKEGRGRSLASSVLRIDPQRVVERAARRGDAPSSSGSRREARRDDVHGPEVNFVVNFRADDRILCGFLAEVHSDGWMDGWM